MKKNITVVIIRKNSNIMDREHFFKEEYIYSVS